MAVVRHNILSDTNSLQKFALGVNRLKQDFSAGVTTKTLGFGGEPTPVSAYDQFVIWHYVAMNTETPARNPAGRNTAHRGSVFLPWHRFMLLLLERHLQRVLEDTTFGLPYWDWAAGDGGVDSPLWRQDGIGGNGNPVTTGPFAFDPNLAGGFRVFFEEDLQTGTLRLNRGGRGLHRQLGEFEPVPDLPTTEQVKELLNMEQEYDSDDWVAGSAGFRNRLEGWPRQSEPNEIAFFHNRVHVWIGGDMGPGTSPNDPAFYLNHCNVDRIWESWMVKRGRNYLPTQDNAGAPAGHRLNDEIKSLVTTRKTSPAEMLDVTNLYAYDALPAS